jgi:hypothetical protein
MRTVAISSLTIEREAGTLQTYDPRRLSGVSVHREAEREFSQGDRVQFTAPSKELQVANRDLGTVEQVNSQGDFKIRWTQGLRFDSTSASIRMSTVVMR